MKISKKTLLITSGMLSISALGLMFVSAADRELFMDVHNAIQHIDTIKVISTGSYGNAILRNTNGLVKIETNNFILGETGNNNMIADSGSSILGGESNEIIGSYNVIIGGSGNTSKGTHNTIIGGESNTLTGYLSYNTVVGGKNNQIIGGNKTTDTNNSNFNVIVGGHDNTIYHSKYSVIMGNNSSVKGDNSFALGSGSHIEANNSFLWTDGNYPETLKANDVFVIMAQSGAIINANQAHSFAKLTLGGPLVLSNSNNQSGIQCGQSQGGGIIKMEKSENNQLCICSCDGSGRNSMFSNGACSKVCNKFIEPPKCGTEVNAECTRRGIVYSGTCGNGKVIEGTGSYFVDKNDIVHRSCQTADGQVDSSCTGKTTSDIADIISTCKPECANGQDFDKDGKSCNSSLVCPDGYTRKDANSPCELIRTCKNEWGLYKTNYYSPSKSTRMQGFSGQYGYDRYMPLNDDTKRHCVNNEDFDPTTMMHTCTFTCAEGYECGYINEGSSTSETDEVATCLPVNRCYGDYTSWDGTLGKTGEIVRENFGLRQPRRFVYRNVKTPLNKAPNYNNIFEYVDSIEDLQGKESENAEGCFVACGPGTTPVTNSNQWGSVEYKTIEIGEKSTARPGYAGYCQPLCPEESFPYVSGYQYRRASTNQRGTGRQYKKLSEYNELTSNNIDACLWTCPDNEIAITSEGDGNTRQYINEVTEEDVTDYFAGEKKIDNTTVTNGAKHICRKRCNENQYFYLGRLCRNVDNGYIVDSTKFVEYGTDSNGTIKNYTAQIKRTCSNTGEVWLETLNSGNGGCTSKKISNSQICEHKNPEGKNWYRFENGYCTSCPVSQHYNTETKKCEPCPDTNAADCVQKQ